MSNDKLQNFDEYADDYEKLLNEAVAFAGADGEYYAEYKIEKLERFVASEKNSIRSILEFGCGTGKNLAYLRKTFPEARLHGCDISQASLDIANTLHLADCTAEYFDGKQLPYPNSFFDLILVVNVLHHIPFELHEQVLLELKRVLNDNKMLAIFEHNPINPVTRRIVRDCPFDKDARLLTPRYSRKIMRQVFGMVPNVNFILFIPPRLKKLSFLENYLQWLPIGAQYAAIVRKSA